VYNYRGRHGKSVRVNYLVFHILSREDHTGTLTWLPALISSTNTPHNYADLGVGVGEAGVGEGVGVEVGEAVVGVAELIKLEGGVDGSSRGRGVIRLEDARCSSSRG
jgi:hypothetical protein